MASNPSATPDEPAWESASVVRVLPAVAPRKLNKVPFVELADGRLQGVVSSGSDISRVYVASVTAGTHGLSCSTNNNRPCGGLNQGWVCKHLDALIEEAVLQSGRTRWRASCVSRSLTAPDSRTASMELATQLRPPRCSAGSCGI
jgi:hypothetical protein